MVRDVITRSRQYESREPVGFANPARPQRYDDGNQYVLSQFPRQFFVAQARASEGVHSAGKMPGEGIFRRAVSTPDSRYDFNGKVLP